MSETTRCRLPFPIGGTSQWIEVQITGLQACLTDLNRPPLTPEETARLATDDDFLAVFERAPTVEVSLLGHYPDSYGCRECHLAAQATFYLSSAGFCETGDSITFPTIGIAVTHMMLGAYSGDILNLPEPAATRWRELQHIERRWDREPLDAWQRRPEAERAAIIAARDEAKLAETVAAHALLDAEVYRLTGQEFDELVESGRPFGFDEYRYLDGAREYTDGSTDDTEIEYRGGVVPPDVPGPRWSITVKDFAGERPLPLHLDVVRHSPTGFSWGYAGRGPHQTALALLCDALGDVRRARQLHQAFTLQRIGTLPMEKGWRMTRSDVLAWIATQPAEVDASVADDATLKAATIRETEEVQRGVE